MWSWKAYQALYFLLVVTCVMDDGTLGSSIPGAVLQSSKTGHHNLLLPIRLEVDVIYTCGAFRCPEGKGWSPLADKGESAQVCLWTDGSRKNFFRAKSTCIRKGARLLTIRSQERQRAVNAFLAETDERVWTGLYGRYWTGTPNEPLLDGDYMNWSSEGQFKKKGQTEYCVYLKRLDRTWGIPKTVKECTEKNYRFFCELPAECDLRVVECDEECHCYGGVPCQGGQPCPHGCERGWIGPRCCTRQEKSEVAYYCVNSPQDGRYLMLRVDPRGVPYDSMAAVDETGGVLPWCGGLQVSRDRDGRYTVIIRVTEYNEGLMGATCAGKKTGSNTFDWTISLQQKAGLRMPLDRILKFSCDFDNAQTMRLQTQHSIFVNVSNYFPIDSQLPVEKPDETEEDVELTVIDPRTGSDITQGMLGRNVELCLRRNVSDDRGVRAKGVYPFDCRVTTVDRRLQRNLTDHNGCPVDDSPISSLRKSDWGVCTSPFQLFALPDHHDVIFSCSLGMCFDPDDPMCDDRCGASAGLTFNRRRATDDEAMYVETSLRIVSEPIGPGH